jgi:LPPG:FO 2-phospho-L-lactate transferase
VIAALAVTSAPVVAVSPMIGDRAVSGPAARMLAARGLDVSPLGVADAYRPWLDALVVDRSDAGLAAPLEARGVRPVLADALMLDGAAEDRLARAVLDAAGMAA